MSMTAKDYTALARIIRAEIERLEADQHTDDFTLACAINTLLRSARAIADHCADNPKFDRERFLRDCGVVP